VSKGRKENLKPIYNGSQQRVLDKINEQLDLLFQQDTVTYSIKEHGKHFQDHLAFLNQEKLNAKESQINQSIIKSFYVQAWDKNKLDTFLLGNYLSCCLATDGAQFHAIVQRRMDASMMMHVIIDQETNEPVCGDWLFFAHDKNDNDSIYVVANFFEIRAGYAMNKNLRDQMVNELLKFTGDYAKHIKAKGFIIRPLTYGLIPDFNDRYSLVNLVIEKLGGYFSASNYEEGNQYSYYLDAINCDKFYQYKSDQKYDCGFFGRKDIELADSQSLVNCGLNPMATQHADSTSGSGLVLKIPI
jgi:hypothetical protein